MKTKKVKVWSPDSYIKSHLRKIWRWSPQRRACLKAKECLRCNKRRKLYADHIEPVVDPIHGFEGWDVYVQRLFNGKLQPLCETCHKAKSKIENAERRRVKKERVERCAD